MINVKSIYFCTVSLVQQKSHRVIHLHSTGSHLCPVLLSFPVNAASSRLSSCVSAASSVDFLMSDEDDSSFLSLPSAAFSQRPSLTAELNETNTPSQQLLIEVTWSDSKLVSSQLYCDFSTNRFLASGKLPDVCLVTLILSDVSVTLISR